MDARFRALIALIFLFLLSGCKHPFDYIFPIVERATITPTLSHSSGRYEPLPTAVTFTFPSAVTMTTVSSSAFSVTDQCAGATVSISGVTVTGSDAVVALNSTAGCTNGESYTISVNYGQMEAGGKDGKGNGSFTYIRDNVGPTVSASVGSITNISTSGAYTLSSAPYSVTYYFSSDIDFSTITSADLSVAGVNTPCSVLPTIDNLTPDTSTNSLIVGLVGATCASGESFSIALGANTVGDKTLDGATATSAPNTGPLTALTLDLMIFSSTVSVTGVGSGSTSASGNYTTGNNIDIEIDFNYTVAVTGTPRLQLNVTGGGTRYANYLSGSGTTTLVFRYTVTSGDTASDLDYASTSALQLNGGAIDLSGSGGGVQASLTLATPGASGSLGSNRNILVDSTPPTITSSSPSGTTDTWNLASRSVTFTFSEAIDVASVADTDLTITAGTCGSAPTVTSSTVSGGNVVEFNLSSNTCSDGETYTLAFDPADITDLHAVVGSGTARSIVVTTDSSGPTISVSAPSNSSVNSSGSLSYTVTYTGASSVTLSNGDVNFAGSSTGCTAAVTGSGTTTRVITITNCSDDGAVQVDISAGTAADNFSNTSAAVPETSITDFDADNTALPNPTINLPTIGSNVIYNEDTDADFILTFAGDALGSSGQLQSSLSLSCDTGSGMTPVSFTATRTSATIATIVPSEVSPDFIYAATCEISGTNVPDAAGNLKTFSPLTFVVANTPAGVSGPNGNVSISSATSAGDLGTMIFNVAMDTSALTISNVTLTCDSANVGLTALTSSNGDKNFLVDFDETDGNWVGFTGGESCTLHVPATTTNSLGIALTADVDFNFTLDP